ncbi:hypothetical protein P261_00470 [Lachnospiraceae bacterium TWA4]|nr:hypothetical protein P261_00470 [Lachnospiraceae bacterium TWA4]
MDEFMNIEEATAKWGISARRIRFLCNEGRIEGAKKDKNSWKIPIDTKKPEDQRLTTGKYVKNVRKFAKGRRTILIADDDSITREMLSEVFKKHFTIYESCDGEETIQMIDTHKEQLSMILLDLRMPKLDGIDVLKTMNKRGLIDKIPVILITGGIDS